MEPIPTRLVVHFAPTDRIAVLVAAVMAAQREIQAHGLEFKMEFEADEAPA